MNEDTVTGESAVQVEVSGYCVSCTFGDRFVFHDTPWCPRQFATAWCDTNEGEPSDDGRYVRFVKPSRPVSVGELVLLVDTGDGEDVPFATWGRVVSVNDPYARCVDTGWTDGPSGWLYTEPWGTLRTDDSGRSDGDG